MYKSIWESYPIPEEKIKQAVEMQEQGLHGFTICQRLALPRSEMLYWMMQYKNGRRWENTEDEGLNQ